MFGAKVMAAPQSHRTFAARVKGGVRVVTVDLISQVRKQKSINARDYSLNRTAS